MKSVDITTLAGNRYIVAYADYDDLATAIHSIDENFHPKFQRLIREDGEEVFPAAFSSQPELDDGEHVRLMMINTVWVDVDSRHDTELCTIVYMLWYGHLSNETGMYKIEIFPWDYRSFHLKHDEYDWDKLLQTIEKEVQKCGWPDWQRHTVIDELYQNVKKQITK